MSGGWSASDNCASQVSNDPTTTVLDAQYQGPVLGINLQLGFSGQFKLRNLTLTRGKMSIWNCDTDLYVMNCASGLKVETWSDGAPSVEIDNILVTAGLNANGIGGCSVQLLLDGFGFLRFRNSIVMRNSLDSEGYFTTPVCVAARDGGIAYVTNNSIHDNQATDLGIGLYAKGIVNLSNNAVADNTTTVPGVRVQFYAEDPASMTWRNNHFGTMSASGQPAAVSDTTTGDAMWTLNGYRRIPNVASPLRDSGINNPGGGIPSIDFSGTTRIINGTIDRGAVEPAVPPEIGPTLTPASPSNGSTTQLTGPVDRLVETLLFFGASGGTPGGITSLTCNVTSGSPGAITENESQTISYGNFLLPVRLTTSPQPARLI